MQPLIPLLLLTATAASVSVRHVRYVKPTDSVSGCPDLSCLTLDQYMEQPSVYFTTGSIFLFLPGSYLLETTVVLRGVSNISFIGASQGHGVTFALRNDAIILFINVTRLKIQGITFLLNSAGTFELYDSVDVEIINSKFQDGREKGNSLAVVSSMNTSILMQGCFFSRNRQAFSSINSRITLKDSSFLSNEAKFGGGAIDASNSSIQVSNCTFVFNVGRHGGAISVYTSILNMTANAFIENTAKYGGAICALNSVITLTDESYSYNSALVGGGAISSIKSNITLYNSSMIRNRAKKGGALSMSASVFRLTSNIFLENNATFYGGALFASESNLALLGNIFRSNIVNNSSTGAAIFANNSEINRNETVANIFFNNTAINGGESPPISSPNSVITLSGKRKYSGSSPRAHSAALTFPMLSEMVPPSIVAYYSDSRSGGYVGIMASMNETKIMLAGDSADGEQRYMLYSLTNPKALAFFDPSRPTSVIGSLNSRNGFLSFVRTMTRSREFFTNLGRAINCICSNCSLNLLGIGYFADNRITRLL